MTTFRLLIASCLMLTVVLVSGSVVHAQARAGVGLITAVDLATSTLVLETQTGSRQVRVAPTATIRDDHGVVLSMRGLTPGDAISYETASNAVASLGVARQFWAIPRE